MARPKFFEMTAGRQIAEIEGVIRELWEHDEANGQEASRIVDPHAPEEAWIEAPPDALVPVREPVVDDQPDATDEADA